MAMDRADRGGLAGAPHAHAQRIARAREWIEGLQSRDGDWAAFDADNTHSYLNHIPFADHGALLDPPTADVTARCVSLLAQLGETTATSRTLARGVEALLNDQEKDGSWFGRWGMNYIYGTWSALCALAVAGQGRQSAPMRRAVSWLVGIQNPDGGWGEGGDSYKLGYKGYEPAPSTASQTAWALLGLMAAGEADHPAVARGVAYLAASQGEDGFLGRTVPHRDRLSAGVLSSLSRIFEVLSAVGARPLPESQTRQQSRGAVRNVAILKMQPGGARSRALVSPACSSPDRTC